MKKLWILFCALAVALLPMTALAANGDAVIARDEYVDSVFADGDTLYIVSGMELLVYHIGDADATAYTMKFDLEAFCEEGESAGYSSVMYADGGKLYAISYIMRYGEDNAQMCGAVLSEVVIGEDGVARLADSREIEWPEELIAGDGDSTYPVSMQSLSSKDGVLYFMDYSGRQERYCVLDVETMKLTTLPLENVQVMTPYKDGKLLMYSYDYNADKLLFEAYDPATGKTETLCEMSQDAGNLSGLACNTETGEVYCVLGGEICPVDVTTGTIGEGVADLPVTVYSNVPGLMMGDYFVYASDSGVVIRNTKPETRPTRRIKVCDSEWMEQLIDAYFDFTNTHGDVSVSISRDYNDYNNVVEDMMNRENNVDIYLFDVRTESFDALRQRGYMAELDGSEKLTAAVENMYPSIRDALTRDGHLVAVPVQAYCWTMGVNERALEKIGLTLEDVPTNWLDFLDFLTDVLPQHMTQESGVTLFYDGLSAQDARWTMFTEIFQDYVAYVSLTMDMPEYDTELMRGLLEKLERVDFTALGLPEEEDDSGTGGVMVYGDDRQLFDINMGTAFGYYRSVYTPIIMRMDADAPEILQMQVYAAFVNPFSEEKELCVEFLETLMDSLDEATFYNFRPDLSEPIKNPKAEEYIQNAQEYLDDVTKQYEEAEEVDKQALEEEVKNAQDWLEREKQDSWMISAEQIEWFRAHDDNLVPEGSNWLYSESAGEAYELMQQYLDGQIDARQFLQGVEKKARMMQMEGN